MRSGFIQHGLHAQSPLSKMLGQKQNPHATREMLDSWNAGGPKLAAFWPLDPLTELTNRNAILQPPQRTG
jgi:hypothetical protein